jgi:hypothetical protein
VAISREKQVKSELPGGLGNQLFAFAAGLAVSEARNCKLILDSKAIDYSHAGKDDDIRSLLSIKEFVFYRSSDLTPFLRKIRDSVFFRIPRIRKSYDSYFGIVNDRNVTLRSGVLESLEPYLENKSATNVHLKGYFQDFSIVARVKDRLISMIREDFSKIGTELSHLLERREILGIHVRGGDFLSTDWRSKVGNLSTVYYESALRELGSKGYIFDEVWVFTNDLKYAEELLKAIEVPFKFIDSSLIKSPAENFNLMRRCSGLITANSSFSFMAAFLTIRSRVVIVPKYFSKAGNKIFGIPKFWIELESNWN